MKQAILFCLIVLTFFSCKKSAPVSYPSGSIEVYVKLYDEFGKQVTGAGGVIVTIIDTLNNGDISNNSYLKNHLFQDTADASGKCNFSNVPAGYYTFVYSKDGYGTIVQYNTYFLPETAPYTLSATMASTSSTIVSNLHFDTVGSVLWLVCNINAQSPYSSVRFFWGTNSAITPDSNYVSMALCNTLYNFNVLDTAGLMGFSFAPTTYFTKDNKGDDININSGDTIYAIAYGEVNAPTLYKYPNGITKYPNLNTKGLVPVHTVVP